MREKSISETGPLSTWAMTKKLLKYTGSFVLADAAIIATIYLSNSAVGLTKDEVEFAASGIATAQRMLFFSFGMPLPGAAGIVVSTLYGQLKRAEGVEKEQILAGIGQMFGHGLLPCVIYGAFFMALSIYFTKPALLAVGQDSDVTDFVQDYYSMRSFAPGFGLSFIMMFIQNFYGGLGKPHIRTVSSVFYLVASVAAGLYFVGHKRWGLSGAGLSESIAAGATVLALLAYMIGFDQSLRDYPIWQFTRQHFKKHMIGILNIAIGMGIQIGSEFTAKFILTLRASKLGESALVVYTIIGQTTNLMFIPFFGGSQGASVLIGEEMGKQSVSTARRYGLLALALFVSLAAIESGLMVAIPQLLAAPFLTSADDTDEVSDLIVSALPMAAIVNLLDAPVNLFSGFLSGYQKATDPMLLRVISLAAMIPLSWKLSDELGLPGLILGQAAIIGLFDIPLSMCWNYFSKRPQEKEFSKRCCSRVSRYLPDISILTNRQREDEVALLGNHTLQA